MTLDQLPRGIRNNNPGNIRLGIDWEGLGQGSDTEFCFFRTPAAGIRAIGRILKTYRKRGIVTFEQVIKTWAPPNENDTDAYIKAVCKHCSTQPALDTLPYQAELVQSIIKHETGMNPYTTEFIKVCLELE